jgi:hypothetical protein
VLARFDIQLPVRLLGVRLELALPCQNAPRVCRQSDQRLELIISRKDRWSGQFRLGCRQACIGASCDGNGGASYQVALPSAALRGKGCVAG